MRKLAYGAAGFSAAIFLAHFALPAQTLPWTASGALFLALASFVLPGEARRRVLLVSVCAVLGFGWYLGFLRLRLEPVRAVSDEVRTVSARVTEFPQKSEYATGLTVYLTEPSLPRVRAQLYDPTGESASLRPGDEIVISVRLRPATQRYGEETDTYLSRGVYFTGNLQTAPEKTGIWGGRFLYAPKTLVQTLRLSAQRAFPADVLPFAQALMLGDKQALYAEHLDVPLSIAGVMHTVAVSGMHLAYLLGFVRLLTGRRRAALLGIPLMAVFVVMAGCSPSVLRAAFMALLLMLAPVVRRENDPPTALSAALAVLLACNPFSAGSVSLQLSFAAMAGIFLLSDPIYRAFQRRFLPRERAHSKGLCELLRFAGSTLASSLGATAFTIPLTALHFGSVSLVAPVTNLLILWVLPVGFLGCWLAALAALVWPGAGSAIAWLAAWPLRYVLVVTKGLSALPAAALFTGNRLVVWWLIFGYVLFAAVWLLSPRGKFRPVLPACCCVCTLCAVILLGYVRAGAARQVTALDVGQGQCVAFYTGRETVLVDCGGKGTPDNAGDTAARYLRASGRNTVDLLVLTHPHEDHVSGVVRLLQWVKVHTLAIPAAADAEASPLREILAEAERKGVRVVRLDADSTIAAGEMTIAAYVRPGMDQEDGCLMVRVSIGTFDTLITGDVRASVEERLAEAYDLGGTELLLAGHHGSRASTGDILLEATGARYAIISSGYNTYGHPTGETLQRLARHGIEIYRTDLMGNVTVRMQ